MSDSFTEVTEQSWFSRLGNAIKGVLVGLVMFVLSFPLLWWNEGRAVRTAKGLKQAGGAVVSVAADKIDAAQDKQLVHVTAPATTDETLSDTEFGVSVAGIRLSRRVEMYQWQEHKEEKQVKKLGGGTKTETTYTYKQTWAKGRIDSDHFKHQEGHANPSPRFASHDVTAEVVHLGAFRLSPSLVAQMSNFTPLTLDAEMLDRLPAGLKKQCRRAQDTLYLPKDSDQNPPDPEKPQVGDVRITFQVVKPATVSVLARQLGDTFEAWQAATGTQVERLTVGEVSAQNMLGQMERENTIFTWLLRAVGFLLMAFGIGMVFGPVAVMADVLPFLGDLLRMGVGLFAAVVAAGLSLTTIAVAWLAYRPWLGIGLLVLALVLVVALKRFGARKRLAA